MTTTLTDYEYADIHYSMKLLLGFLCGIRGVEIRGSENPDLWTEAGSIDFARRDEYYMCVAFRDGSHLPLPMLLEDVHDDYPIQSAIIRALRQYIIADEAVEPFYQMLDWILDTHTIAADEIFAACAEFSVPGPDSRLP
jgi:hypothetical protein